MKTTTAFRISKAKYSAQAYTGQGAKNNPGRWNLAGFAMVYTSENTSLACLETVSHLMDDFDPTNFVILKAFIPLQLIEIVDPNQLPIFWDADHPGLASQEFGTEWLLSLRSAVLKVPSVLVPNDFNFLINPQHPDFAKIEIGQPVPFQFHKHLTYKRRAPNGR